MKDKIKEFRDKNPILDFAAGFIPGVGEAQDAQDFVHAAKKKDYGKMALASLGFIIPGITGGQFLKILRPLTKTQWGYWAAKHLDELSTVRPRLAEGIARKEEEALKINDTLQKIAKGKVHIPEKRGIVKDIDSDTPILPFLDERGYNLTPEARVNAAIDYAINTEKGRAVPGIMGGAKGIQNVEELIPGFPAFKTIKGERTRMGQFTSNDILTALYYSGHGKIRTSNAVFEAIKNAPASPQAKQYAFNQLEIVERILQKYSKNTDSVGVFKATRVAKKGRNNAPDAERTHSYGLIPDELINPKSEQAIKDRIHLEESLNNLGTWFGSKNSNGVAEFYGPIPMNLYTGNYGGGKFGGSKNHKLFGFNNSIIVNNQDDLAVHIANSKDKTMGLITDIQDGAGVANDIVFQPYRYNLIRQKKGGRICLTTSKKRGPF